jgi:hypothetical protein
MDAAQALTELMELSSQLESVVVLGPDGSILASSDPDSATSQELAETALELVGAAFDLSATPVEVTRVEVELGAGALFVLREDARTIAARTGPQPTSGLVVYDLRTCLRAIDDPEPKKTSASRRSRKEAE